MHQPHPIQKQVKKLLDEHGIQILDAFTVESEELLLIVQDVVSGQKATLTLPFGKEV